MADIAGKVTGGKRRNWGSRPRCIRPRVSRS
jgi:hypothetical protein